MIIKVYNIRRVYHFSFLRSTPISGKYLQHSAGSHEAKIILVPRSEARARLSQGSHTGSESYYRTGQKHGILYFSKIMTKVGVISTKIAVGHAIFPVDLIRRYAWKRTARSGVTFSQVELYRSS